VDGVLFSESCSNYAGIKAAEEQDKVELEMCLKKRGESNEEQDEENERRIAELEANQAKADAAKKTKGDYDKA
jgi:hypothetical protein